MFPAFHFTGRHFSRSNGSRGFCHARAHCSNISSEVSFQLEPGACPRSPFPFLTKPQSCIDTRTVLPMRIALTGRKVALGPAASMTRKLPDNHRIQAMEVCLPLPTA